jgi:nucleotide-binding universal stress UspA family protein
VPTTKSLLGGRLVFNRVIVPVDGSNHSWRAAEVAAVVARQCVAELELLEVVDAPQDVEPAVAAVTSRAAVLDVDGEPIVTAIPVDTSVAVTVANHARSVLGAIIVISSSGRGRTEALVGSVAAELLDEMYGPLVVVGPRAKTRGDLRGRLVVPVDGSAFGEAVLGLAVAIGIGFEAHPWIVEVLPPNLRAPSDVIDSSYPASVARRLAEQSHHPVDYEVLHDSSPERAIARFAADLDASLIVASTHGTTGLVRLASGSRAMAIVRHAPCPVVLSRPPQLHGPLGVADASVQPRVAPVAVTRQRRRGFDLDRASPRVRATVSDLARRLGVAEAAIEVTEARAVTWPDASYGCPEPGMMYVQRPVDGSLVVLAYAERRYEYHGGTPLTLCEHPHPPIGG